MPVLATIAPVLLFSNYRADAPENEAETALKQFRELAKLFQREAAAEAEIARWFAQIDAYGDAVRKAFGFVSSNSSYPLFQSHNAFLFIRLTLLRTGSCGAWEWRSRSLGLQAPMASRR